MLSKQLAEATHSQFSNYNSEQKSHVNPFLDQYNMGPSKLVLKDPSAFQIVTGTGNRDIDVTEIENRIMTRLKNEA